MKSHILLVAPQSFSTTLIGAISQNADLECTHTSGIKGALKYLVSDEFAVILLDNRLTSARPAWTATLFQNAGLAQILELSFHRADPDRVLLNVRAAINRRAHYQWRAYEAAASRLAAEFSPDISALVTESELLLQSATQFDRVRMRKIAQLSGNLRSRMATA